MLHKIKKRLYFVVAAYFAFWAKFVLRRWKPRVVIITGSSGKTTLLHLVEAQVGDKAVYSHHANSAIGISFHILGMVPNVQSRLEWPLRLLFAPFHMFRKIPAAEWYIVEADCDRPREGQFLADLLYPEVTLWVSVYRTHSMNFDSLVQAGKFKTHEEAIAYEFGYYIAAAQKMIAVNVDQDDINKQLERVKAGVDIKRASMQLMTYFTLSSTTTRYVISNQTISVPGFHPQEMGVSLQLVNHLLSYLELPLDPTYQRLDMPPGRSNIFSGQKGTTLIDSTYNTGLGAMTVILNLFDSYPASHKWVVLGDILEQGSLEAEEHQRLAEVVNKLEVEQIILLGPRTKTHTLPMLKKGSVPVESFDSPKQVLDFISTHLKGGETILFKGGRFLEGVIEQLLVDPNQAKHLVRREQIWVKRRRQWGLPR
jgi:UDP-N-acetylmuramoyl-tripeptide--D-alanyl-D-alanine ligase